MYSNTTKKVFIANTAARIMADAISQEMSGGKINIDTSLDENMKEYSHIAIHAAGAAWALASELEERWRYDGDRETVFFDPEDTPNTEIEKGLDRIVEQLKELI